MKLKRPCPHGCYDEHGFDRQGNPSRFRADDCPGGVFLTEDTLVIDPGHVEEVCLELLKEAGVLRRFLDASGDRQIWQTRWEWSDEYMKPKTDALAVRDGEG